MKALNGEESSLLSLLAQLSRDKNKIKSHQKREILESLQGDARKVALVITGDVKNTKPAIHAAAKRFTTWARNLTVTEEISQTQPYEVSHDVALWSFVSFPELAIVLVHLKALSDIHQTHHWTAKGDNFYGDHLLFDRLYSNTNDEIDKVAERAVGLGGPENVAAPLVAHQVAQIVTDTCQQGSLPTPEMLVRVSLQAEQRFCVKLNEMITSLKSRGILSRGLSNLLDGILDAHDVHTYLLQQRLTNNGGTF